MLYIICFAVIFFFIVITVFSITKKAKVRKCMTFDNITEQAVLKLRSPMLKPYIKINQLPEDMNSTKKSEKYFLTVRFPHNDVNIVEIKLNDKTLAEAKNNADIKKFISGDKLVLVYNNDDTKLTDNESYILGKAIEKNNRPLMEYTMQRANLARELTLPDCQKIVNWLCGM